MLQRYEQLELRIALSRKCNYAEACKELAVILRGGYSKVPKNLQALLFQDTLAAFRLLSEVGSSQGISAANLLLQAAEASLPKQKKALAVTEFKHAAVALRRHSKVRQGETELVQLADDILIHIFGFLDVRSLVAAGLVCRSWNLSAKENTLWKAHYSLHFGDDLPNNARGKWCTNNAVDDEGGIWHQSLQKAELNVHIDWHEAFKKRYRGHPSRVVMSDRAYCKTCKSPVWLSNKGVDMDGNTIKQNHRHMLKPMLPGQVLHFLLGDSMASSSSSSSDSDSDSDGVLIVEQRFSKLWAYPRLIQKSFDAEFL